MNETEALDRVVAALRKVKEKRLLIIDLANKACSPSGELDFDLLNDMKPEVNLAIAEAKMYGAYTLMAVDVLKRLPAKVNDV